MTQDREIMVRLSEDEAERLDMALRCPCPNTDWQDELIDLFEDRVDEAQRKERESESRG